MMDKNRTKLIIIGIGAFAAGWIVGLFLFGWYIWPVSFSGADPELLTEANKEIFLDAISDLYAFDNDRERLGQAFATWPNADQEICAVAAETVNAAQASRLEAVASVLNNGQGCSNAATAVFQEEVQSDEESSTALGLIVGLVAILAVVVVAIFIIWKRRGQLLEVYSRGISSSSPAASSSYGSTMEKPEEVTAIARFETTYVRGHDTYDDSFSVENADGDFLGECGVGLSDTIGTDTPKNVTAFEVWLFDKNDIRTVTKVVMSDHAFFDDAIKAKLAPKGEPILARPNETIVLETASLIVNANITEMEYGSGILPPQSFFERFTVDLSAWAKQGDTYLTQDQQSDSQFDEIIDEMLEY